jgi:hypothetical protein
MAAVKPGVPLPDQTVAAMQTGSERAELQVRTLYMDYI